MFSKPIGIQGNKLKIVCKPPKNDRGIHWERFCDVLGLLKIFDFFRLFRHPGATLPPPHRQPARRQPGRPRLRQEAAKASDFSIFRKKKFGACAIHISDLELHVDFDFEA